jgi:hypothetical protein
MKNKTKKVNPEKIIADNFVELIDSPNYNPRKIGEKIAKELIHKFENNGFAFGNDPALASECTQMIIEAALDKIRKKYPSYLI